ncbi:MAG: S8 family serine peptidase [Candidatus Eiseniibacteriota bacterium]
MSAAGRGLLGALLIAGLGLSGARIGRTDERAELIARTHRQWVVALRALPGSPSPGAGRAMPARLAARLAALGLSPLRTLADCPGGFDLEHALAARDRGASAASSRSATGQRFGLDPARIWLIEAADSAAGAHAAAALAAEPQVEWLEPNVTRHVLGWRERAAGAAHERRPSGPPASRVEPLTSGAAGVPAFPDDPLFRWGRQWSLYNVGPAGPFGGTARADNHASEGWSISSGRDDVILAVADTGIDPDQPDLGGLLANGQARILAPVNLTGVDPPDSIFDRRGHGTMCAGVMAARSNNGVSVDTLGMAGVCGGDGVTNSGCRIVPMKVTAGTTEETTSYTLAQAILYASAMGARAMNLSIAGLESSQLERLALYDAITHGCVVSAAAGNSGSQAFPLYPSAYAIDGLCIEVGASDVNDQRAVFSTYGPWLDLVAPGENIFGTFMTYPNAFGGTFPGYVAGSGTSFAAPQVAGAVGLLCATRPELIENDFQHIIRESAHDLGTPGVDSTTAWGRLDLGAALSAVPPSVGIWHGQAAGVLGALIATDSLVIADSSQAPGGPPPRVWANAREYEVTATVAIPDSFSGPVRIWPRVGVTSTVRGGFRLAYFAPWAEVSSQSARSFTLRGYVYQSGDTCAGCDAFIPVPVSDLDFGFTVMGPVNRTPPPQGAPGMLSITPNPAVGAARIVTAPGASVTILDLSGRRVRETKVDPVTGVWNWDGLDAAGRRVRAGVYLVRSSAPGVTRDGKLVVLR